jgi:hypothetical protein
VQLAAQVGSLVRCSERCKECRSRGEPAGIGRRGEGGGAVAGVGSKETPYFCIGRLTQGMANLNRLVSYYKATLDECSADKCAVLMSRRIELITPLV